MSVGKNAFYLAAFGGGRGSQQRTGGQVWKRLNGDNNCLADTNRRANNGIIIILVIATLRSEPLAATQSLAGGQASRIFEEF